MFQALAKRKTKSVKIQCMDTQYEAIHIYVHTISGSFIEEQAASLIGSICEGSTIAPVVSISHTHIHMCVFVRGELYIDR
jgi:hypothetical protein